MTHAQLAAPPSSASDRAPMLCGIAVGVMQAATPLAFWWLDGARPSRRWGQHYGTSTAIASIAFATPDCIS
jgi:hypothetical protein